MPLEFLADQRGGLSAAGVAGFLRAEEDEDGVGGGADCDFGGQGCWRWYRSGGGRESGGVGRRMVDIFPDHGGDRRGDDVLDEGKRRQYQNRGGLRVITRMVRRRHITRREHHPPGARLRLGRELLKGLHQTSLFVGDVAHPVRFARGHEDVRRPPFDVAVEGVVFVYFEGARVGRWARVAVVETGVAVEGGVDFGEEGVGGGGGGGCVEGGEALGA